MKYKDSMRDYPPPATHNLVFVSNTEKSDAKVRIFLGKVISLWVMEDKLESTIAQVMKDHAVTREDITIKAL